MRPVRGSATSLNADKTKYATAPLTDDGRITISKLCEILHVEFGSVCSFVKSLDYSKVGCKEDNKNTDRLPKGEECRYEPRTSKTAAHL